MTAPLRSDPERHAAAPSTSPPPTFDDADEPWCYEWALPYLQGCRRPAGVRH